MGAGDEGGDKKQKSAVVDHLWKPEYNKRKIKNDILPYKSIDVVFNKKNVWINLQHPDPVRILYDLYNNTKWHCVLKTKDDAGKELVWKNDIPTFYSFRNFAPAYSEDELDALKKAISKTVNDSIKTTRLLKNFPTKFKRAVF